MKHPKSSRDMKYKLYIEAFQTEQIYTLKHPKKKKMQKHSNKTNTGTLKHPNKTHTLEASK